MDIKRVRDLANFVEEGNILFVVGEDGAGKSSFCVRICDELSKKGFKTKYISLDHPSFELDIMIARWNADPKNFEIKDYYEVIRTEEKLVVDIFQLLSPKEKEVVVLDSITALLLFTSPHLKKFWKSRKEFLKYIENFFNEMRKYKNKIFIITGDIKLLEKEVLKRIEELSDAVLEIEIVGGKRHIVLKKEGEKILECDVGYQGELECK